MKHLIKSAGFAPTPIGALSELGNFSVREVSGIVISTAISSKVSDTYWDVIKTCSQTFPNKPLFLASYSSVRSTKITAGKRLKENGVSFELVSLEELETMNFDNKTNILILTQKEISDQVKFPEVLNSVKGILNTFS